MLVDFSHSLLLGAMASLDAAPELEIHFPAPGGESTPTLRYPVDFLDRDRAIGRPSGTRSVLTPGGCGQPSVGCSLMHENLSNVHLPNKVGSQLHACASNFQLSHSPRLCSAYDVPYESISSDPSMALICMYQASMSQQYATAVLSRGVEPTHHNTD